jgi:thiol-disulfide isomerase/thioredoxin
MSLSKTSLFTLISVVLTTMPASGSSKPAALSMQENGLSDSTSLEQREQAFRKKWYIAPSEKVTFKLVPSVDELADMIAKDPELENKKDPKKTVDFPEFEKSMTKAGFQYSKIMNDAGISFVEYSQKEQEERAKRVEVPLKVKMGEVFPAFSLASSDGATSDNAMFIDRLTLITFFFDKCVPCIEETPFLNEFSQKHPEIQVLGMTFDSKRQVANYKKDHGFNWRVAYGADTFMSNFLGIRSYPSYALIDGQGKVLAIGSQHDLKLDFKNLVKSLEELIERTTKS